MNLNSFLLSLTLSALTIVANRLVRFPRRAFANTLRVIPALLLFAVLSASAQTGTWTWQGGSNLKNPVHTPGYPDARYGAASWEDTNGNLWLFGGGS